MKSKEKRNETKKKTFVKYKIPKKVRSVHGRQSNCEEFRK